MPTKDLLFIEFQNQINNALDLINSELKRMRIVALSPEAQFGLDELGLHYTIPEDYDLHNRIYSEGQKNFRRLEQFCDFCDAFLWERCPTLKRLNLDNPTFLHFFHLKIIQDGVGLRALFIKQILEAERPESVWYFSDDTRPFNWELLFGESIYSHVIPVVCRQFDVCVHQLQAKPDVSMETSIPVKGELFKTYYTWKRRLRHPVRTLTNASRRLRIYIQDATQDYRPILFVVMNYNNLDQVLKFIESDGCFKIVHSEKGSSELSPDMETNIRKAGSELCEGVDWNSFLSTDGLSFGEIALPRFRYFLTEGIVDLVKKYLYAEEELNRTKPAIAITATSWGYPHRVILKAARNLSIPKVTYQHGGHYGYIDLLREDYKDFADSDYFLSWGDGVSDFLDSHRHTKKNCTKFVSVGSSSIYSLQKKFQILGRSSKNKNTNTNRRLLYASSILMGNIWYISFNLSDSRYYQYQKKLMDIICDCKDVSLLLKLAGDDRTYNPITSFIKTKHHPDCQILNNMPFVDVLQHADLILLDMPTTALLEAIATKVPVIAFDFGDSPFDTPAKEMLKKRVWWADSQTEFFDLIKQVLTDDNWSKWDKQNSEFLEAYATASHGQETTRYIKKKLMEIMDKNHMSI